MMTKLTIKLGRGTWIKPSSWRAIMLKVGGKPNMAVSKTAHAQGHDFNETGF